MKNILITGAAGFIGHQLWKKLEKKYKVYGVDDLSSKPVIAPPKDLIIKPVLELNSNFLKMNIWLYLLHLND